MLGHCSSVHRQGRSSLESSKRSCGRRYDVRLHQMGPATGCIIREEAVSMYMDLAGMNYATCFLAAVMKKVWPSQYSFPGKATEQLGLWVSKWYIHRELLAYLKPMGIFFVFHPWSLQFAFSTLRINSLCSLVVQGNGGKVSCYDHEKRG